jgi:hypothetical protein
MSSSSSSPGSSPKPGQFGAKTWKRSASFVSRLVWPEPDAPAAFAAEAPPEIGFDEIESAADEGE